MTKYMLSRNDFRVGGKSAMKCKVKAKTKETETVHFIQLVVFVIIHVQIYVAFNQGYKYR